MKLKRFIMGFLFLPILVLGLTGLLLVIVYIPPVTLLVILLFVGSIVFGLGNMWG